jgi:D-sedoheptulose 7-phosphate isomerase
MGRFARLVERLPGLVPVEAAIEQAFDVLVRTYAQGGNVLVCGNGGSAADAEHIVGELMKGMAGRRPLGDEAFLAELSGTVPEYAEYLKQHLDEALSTVSLCSQSSLITAVGNDVAGDMGFAQQVYGYGRPGDLLWALSTSGRSRNVVLAAATAKACGMKVLALTGEPGELLGELADVWIKVPSTEVATTQELHLPIYHALCEALEEDFFGDG